MINRKIEKKKIRKWNKTRKLFKEKEQMKEKKKFKSPIEMDTVHNPIKCK